MQTISLQDEILGLYNLGASSVTSDIKVANVSIAYDGHIWNCRVLWLYRNRQSHEIQMSNPDLRKLVDCVYEQIEVLGEMHAETTTDDA